MPRRTVAFAATLALVALPPAAPGALSAAWATSILPGLASKGGWVDTDGARMRLVLGNASPDGVVDAALEIDLDPGFRTYWIAPGPAGIAPRFEAGESTNVTLESVDYPAPIRFEEVYGWSVGYDDDVALPMRFALTEPSRPATVRLSGLLGVCGEICIPVSVSFEQDVLAGVSTPIEANRALIDARAALPVEGGTEGVTATFDGDALVLAGTPIDNAVEVFLAPPDGLELDPPVVADGVARAPVLRGMAGGSATLVVREEDGSETLHHVDVPARPDA